MASPGFRFKQFEVQHHLCTMKVNTDGVLLGALASVWQSQRVLDVGTGCGVIALMLAQRTTKTVLIDAVEIDGSSHAQAKENFLKSTWRERLQPIHTPLQDYFPPYQYDMIISNPPYFVDDLKSANPSLNVAKHSTSLTYNELMMNCSRLLADNGHCSIVVPFFHHALLAALAVERNLFLVRAVKVAAIRGKQPYLAFMEFQRIAQLFIEEDLVIHEQNGHFTSEYIALTKDFYLQF